MFECDLCGGWEHALCTNYYNRIWEGTHLCRNCDTPENRNKLPDRNGDVVVCRCGKTDTKITRELRGEDGPEDEELIVEEFKTKKSKPSKSSNTKSKFQEARKAKSKIISFEKHESNSRSSANDAQVHDSNATKSESFATESTIACSGCGSHVHQRCFGFDGKQCEYHLWIVCVQCKKRLKLESGQSFGGLQCVCGDLNEADKRPRLTCWQCKLQFHIECLDEIDGSPLEPGHMLQCPVCIEHSKGKQSPKCCAAPNRWDT